jgi:hypothetical protein
MRIGMGGGAASSMATGANAAELDFDSVQRGNPEIERRAQEVINHCWSLGAANPVLAIHDVGAGGLSNAFPELTNDAGRGARFDLRKIPLEESGLAPKEIWCNESQERYVLAIAPESLEQFRASASASAARSRWSAWRPRSGSWWWARRAPRRRSTCRWTCCWASRPRCTATSRACGARCRRSTSRASTCRRRRQRAGASDGRFQALPGHHRRPHGGRPVAPRPDGGPVAGAGGRLRGDAGRLPRLRGRGHEHGRAHAAGRHRPGRIGPHGGRRGHHQPAGGAVRAAARQAVGQLDGGVRRAGRRRRAVRDRQGRRHGAVPGAGHLHPGGQGQPVHAHAVEGRRHRQEGHLAGQPGDHRLRHPGRRARHAHAAAGSHHRATPRWCWSTWARAGTAWAAASWRRCSTSPAARCRSRRSAGPGEPGQRGQRLAGAGPPAGVPRPQRRRPVRRRLRDGLRRPRRRER